MNIPFDGSRCGEGKTYHALTEMMQPGLYLLAMDKTDLMRERRKEINKLADQAGADPVIVMINQHSKMGKKTVVEAIENLPVMYGHQKHVIVMITHCSMKEVRFGTPFKEWNMVIDEDFSTFTANYWNLSAAQSHMSDNYNITPVPLSNGIFEVTAKEVAPSITDYRNDSIIDDTVTDFRKMIELQRVYTTDDHFAPSFKWWSVWDFKNLRNLKSVKILANAFTEKVSYQLASLDPEINFVPIQCKSTRVWARRPVTIRYFSEVAGSKTTLFDTDEGNENLGKITDWCLNNDDEPQYWSCNSTFPYLLPGQFIKPMSAGRNDLMELHTATFIYTALATPMEGSILRRITNCVMGPENIQRDREYESLSQFCLRGSLRKPESTHPVEFRVYSKQQAEFLSDFLTRNKYVQGEDVSLEFIDIGITQPVKKVKQARILTTEEKAAKAAKVKEQTRLRVANHRKKK